MKIDYNKGKNISPVAFMFACPGQKEQAAGRVVAGATGKNLNTLLSILAESENEKIRALFPSADRYDYLITNASDTVHYPALDKTSLPSKKEYGAAENVERLCAELKEVKYVIAFGAQAKDVSNLAKSRYALQNTAVYPVFITSLPHLSLLALNQISEDIYGNRIERGDKEATHKRLTVVAKMLTDNIKNLL
jgi:uracil-DNA glycosylase